MTFRSFREESRANWGWTDDNKPTTRDDIQHGAILRIADAVEVMAKRYTELIDDRDYQKRRKEAAEAENKSLVASNRALRGVIKRMKNRG